MTRMTKPALVIFPTLLIGLSSISPTQAQTRAFVAAQGSDANPCTFALPCRTLQHAHDAVAAGGEIDVLDPAGYGAVSINKAVSIQGHGFAGISVGSGGTGIRINAAATDIVNLSGLLIDGAGVGSTGVRLQSGGALHIENCTIRSLLIGGIDFSPNSSSYLYVTDTLVSDVTSNNPSIGAGAISVGGSGNVIRAAINRVLVENSWFGITASGSSTTGSVVVTVADSMIAGNQETGIEADTSSSKPVTIMVRNSSVVNGALDGVVANQAGAVVRLSGNTITQNNNGWTAAGGGVVTSYGNNNIEDNRGTNTAPPPSTLR